MEKSLTKILMHKFKVWELILSRKKLSDLSAIEMNGGGCMSVFERLQLRENADCSPVRVGGDQHILYDHVVRVKDAEIS